MEKIGSAKDLAELLGVGQEAIRKSVRQGRLDQSVIRIESSNKERYQFKLALACYEWFWKKDSAKDRKANLSVAEDSAIPPRAQSLQVREYYGALSDRLDLLSKAQELIPVRKVYTEVFNFTRITRDHISSIPESLRRKMVTLGVADDSIAVLVGYASELVEKALVSLGSVDVDQIKSRK